MAHTARPPPSSERSRAWAQTSRTLRPRTGASIERAALLAGRATEAARRACSVSIMASTALLCSADGRPLPHTPSMQATSRSM